MADFEIGDLVQGKKFGPMDHDFTGIVEKVYNNSIMVSIQDFDPSDKSGVNELNNRAVIRQSEAKMIKAVPRTEKDDDDEEEKDAKSSSKTAAKKTTTKKSSAKKSKTTKKTTKKADK
ncbi:hypothetical protein FD27_GL001191 [Limosilactobacillus frumenti DSM 13145]|uniref:DUF2187 domain-containing protein n=1 Tax=Limosilactobacillus frumenti DSM 13145 TaxID=1423746 RepID=A0A0R1P476_9LACO|nr:hypothetical protein [Limosilactobacillus frumenti]KRL27431.1 hypothetical protein FD27_GL001191 [Limosilactobacillus frumenti DSM 13145]MBA2913289.1 hypothetical protein [Limosilactobacillus frumenti]QFG72870.1 hypothetical protein LF145_05775 [Limosilactobacillus frumenti]